MGNKANGRPTKEFFVEMLTRDIDLNDAILDLLDNCLDGVVRLSSARNKLEDHDFYKGYYAEIKIAKNSFFIKDNCGGIPRNVAGDYAFRMGRVPTTSTNNPTIGIYGIGMKRAIFKIGKAAVVHTQVNNEKYSVTIPANWVKDADDWSFPIDENSASGCSLTENGTEILISPLNNSIAEIWKEKSNIESFIESLRVAIQESYSLIIQKGFVIKINDKIVSSNPVELLAQKGGKTGVRPFVFTHQYGTVNVKLAIGFYAPMASDDEIDEMNESKRSSYDAGITVVCNDRVVLYNDKSYLTGWGTGGVPNYHTQFIGIKGIVIFESSEPSDLPMTTTKRGVDHSSAIYIAVKDKICEGLRTFTNYTNQWKGRNEQERTYSTAADKIDYNDLFSAETQKEYGVALRHESRGSTYRPSLPKPANEHPYRMIRFSKSVDDIKTVRGLIFDDPEEDIAASVVGEECFNRILREAQKGE